MIKRPEWIMDRLRAKEDKTKAKDQITIIAVGSKDRNMMAPISMGSRTTGTGEDRMLQPGKVAGDVHEGEMVLSANATQALPEDVRVELTKQAETGAIDIPALRNALKLPERPGYSIGSSGLPVSTFRPPVPLPTAAKTPSSPSAVNWSSKTSTSTPISAPVINRVVSSVVPGASTSVVQPISAPEIKAEAPVLSFQSQPALPAETRAAPVVTVPEIKAEAPVLSIQNQPALPAETKAAPVITAPETNNNPLVLDAPNQPGQTASGTRTSSSNYDNIINSALRRTVDTAEGKSAVEQNIANQNLRYFDTRAANETAANEMALATDRNMPEGARNSALAQAQSGIRSSRSELIGDMSAAAADRAQAANQTAANMAAEERTYKDNAQWKEYEEAVAAGDFQKAAAAYKRVTGNDISMDQMVRNQKYQNTLQEQGVRTGELGIRSLETRIGVENAQAVSSMINAGQSLTQINATLRAEGKPELSAADYKTMFDATPLGTQKWERNMSYARTLLEAGGTQNIQTAAGMFNEAFPGTGIDFSKLITADKAATFNTGMAQMSDAIAANLSWDEAVKVLEGNGTFEMMGIDPKTPEGQAQMEGVYRGMKTNAIDEQYKAVTESDWWNGRMVDAEGNPVPAPSPEDKASFYAFTSAVLTGKLDYRIQQEYTVTNSDGSTSTMYFNTADEAAKYATANTGSNPTATGKTKVVPVTNLMDPDNPDSTPGDDTATLKPTQIKVGDVVIETPEKAVVGQVFMGANGNLFTVGEDMKPVTFNYTDMTTAQRKEAYDAVYASETKSPEIFARLVENTPKSALRINSAKVFANIPTVGSYEKFNDGTTTVVGRVETANENMITILEPNGNTRILSVNKLNGKLIIGA